MGGDVSAINPYFNDSHVLCPIGEKNAVPEVIFFCFFVISGFFCGHFATDSKKVYAITKKQKNIFSHRLGFFWEELGPKNCPKR